MANQNSSNTDININADGFSQAGGTTKRKLTLSGADVAIVGSGTNVYTMPSATDTLVGRASTDTLTNKDLSSATNTLGGAWAAWTPTFTSAGGTPTTVTINKARYTQIGKTVTARFDFTITNKGTATGSFRFTLPVTALDAVAGGGVSEIAALGVSGQLALLSTTVAYIQKYDGSSFWVSTYELAGALTYEAA